ncbi:MAG: hypothetical protein ACXACF_01575 [Candidatus Hermodarchaeia archaeon]|jgi:hypothetical protein
MKETREYYNLTRIANGWILARPSNPPYGNNVEEFFPSLELALKAIRDNHDTIIFNNQDDRALKVDYITELKKKELI